MMYVYMLIVAVSSFGLNGSSNDFKGSSSLIKSILTVGAGVGFISLLVFTIYAIFKMTWWHPLVGLLVVGTIAPFINGIIKLLPNIIIDILSLVGVIAGSYFMWMSFLI
ncbi:hypothetical protein [Parabacteroides provencensis]|uniref:hypothetical protein n=1 Tax=Parabacteroides provencensis TaxID=1944636 RepID=UPI00117DFD2B|nr:hypothetical protein [Parabacteroides provencensis]